MKAGDLVQVRPLLAGYYILIEQGTNSGLGHNRWFLYPVHGPDAGSIGVGLMSEPFIEVISESR